MASAYGVGRVLSTGETTIPSTETTSGAVALGVTCLASFVVTSTWTEADVTLKGSYDGSTFYNIYDNTLQWTATTVEQNRLIKVDPVYTYGLHSIKFVSSAAQTGANGATIKYSLRPVE